MHLMIERPPPLDQEQPLFQIRALSYTYPDGTKGISEISLDIHRGDRIALVGQNGAGKSTLVRHLNGLLPVQQGELVIGGSGSDKNPAETRRHIGMLFQDPDNHLFCNTLYEDIAFGPMNQGRAQGEVDELVHTQLALVGLQQVAHKPAHLLSYGQKKRAAFAAIMAMQPDILILDEPTANLDPRQEKIFKELLVDFAGTLIIIDHDLLFLYDICKRAVVLSQGQVHHDYSMRELVSHQQALKEHGLDFTFRFSCCGSHDPSQPRHHHHHHHHTHEHNRSSHLPPAAPEPPLLEMQHYSFHYPDHSPGITDINLSVRSGESIALVGENGAGKSTLASCLIGLNQGSGYLLHHGRELSRPERSSLWRQVGLVFQNAADQLFCPSCSEEVAFGPRQMHLADQQIEHRVRQALHQVRLSGFEQRVPLHMSGGERKRLAIAAALAMEPELLILDEPTAGLDPRGEELLLDILEHLPVAQIIITHDLYFISRLSRRTVVMHQGRIVRDYATAEFLADDHLQAVNGLDYTYKSECFLEIQDLQQHRLAQDTTS